MTWETANIETVDAIVENNTYITKSGAPCKLNRSYSNHFNGNVAKLRAIFKRNSKKAGYSRKQFMADCLAVGIPKNTSGWHWLKLQSN